MAHILPTFPGIRPRPLKHVNLPLQPATRKGNSPVTVCIAAISGGARTVVGVCDRMLTAGDIEYEPPQTKIITFGTRMIAMYAGDAAATASIIHRVLERGRTAAASTVAELAEHVAEAFADVRRYRAEKLLLDPLGLSLASIANGTVSLSDDVVKSLIFDMQRTTLEVEFIVTGIDQDGLAHIYRVEDPGSTVCLDGIGFAAIGFGRRHAESQFMLANYTNQWPPVNAALLAFNAKLRAETAPSVGNQSDLFIITGNGGYSPATAEQAKDVREILARKRARDMESENVAYKEMADYIVKLTAPSKPNPAVPPPPPETKHGQ